MKAETCSDHETDDFIVIYEANKPYQHGCPVCRMQKDYDNLDQEKTDIETDRDALKAEVNDLEKKIEALEEGKQ